MDWSQRVHCNLWKKVCGMWGVKVSVFSKSKGLMLSYKKGMFIQKVAGVFKSKELWQWVWIWRAVKNRSFISMEFSFIFFIIFGQRVRTKWSAVGENWQEKYYVSRFRQYFQKESRQMGNEKSHHTCWRTLKGRHITLFQWCLTSFCKQTHKRIAAISKRSIFGLYRVKHQSLFSNSFIRA